MRLAAAVSEGQVHPAAAWGWWEGVLVLEKKPILVYDHYYYSRVITMPASTIDRLLCKVKGIEMKF